MSNQKRRRRGVERIKELRMSKKQSCAQWKIHLESVYRRDREERLKQAYQIIVPETLLNCEPSQKELSGDGERKNRSVRQSIQ